MQISELVKLLQEGIKEKLSEFEQAEKEYSTAKTVFYNDLKLLEQVVKEHNLYTAQESKNIIVDKVKGS